MPKVSVSKSTAIYNIIGYPGAGKTTATLKLAEKLKKQGATELVLDSTNTKYDFKKQHLPVLIHEKIAWVGKDIDTVPAHRKRLGGTESYSRSQRNMLDRVLLSLSDRKYSTIIMDGFGPLRPSVRKAIKRLQARKKPVKFHVLHLTTPYEQSRKSWFKRERRAAKAGCPAAPKALARKAIVDPQTKLEEYDEKLGRILELADTVTPVTRKSIGPVLDEIIAS